MKVNLRHFFALTEIAATRRIAVAAERLFMSQSALTQALRNLEQSAGATLFNRAGFGVTETDAGAVLTRRARRAIDLLTRAEREIRSSSSLYRHVTSSQLRSLSAVVETGGYSTAARRLGVAQPTIHRAAKDLEKLVGVELFIRAARGVEPTDAARILARYSGLVFIEVRQGFEEVRESQGRSDSRIAIGSLPLVRSEFLPLAVTELLDRFPDACVSILDGPYVEQLHALRYGQIDWLIGALREPAPTSDIVQVPLFEQPLAVVVRPNHPLLRGPQPSLNKLAELEWVAPRNLAPARQIFDDLFARGNVSAPTRIIECSSLVATRGLLLNSDRAALLSPLQVRGDIAAGELAILVAEIANSSRTIGVATRDNWEPTLLQRQFTAILRAQAAATGAEPPQQLSDQ